MIKFYVVMVFEIDFFEWFGCGIGGGKWGGGGEVRK